MARAADLGARFFVHMSVAGLAATAGAVETFDSPDLERAAFAMDERLPPALPMLVDAVLAEFNEILARS